MTIDKQKLKALAQAVADLEDQPELEAEHAEAKDALWLHMHCHTILALLAEIERLEHKNANQTESIREYQDLAMGRDVSLGMLKADLRVTAGERDQLKAENEALRKDAERYRWLKVERRPAADLDAAFNTYGVPVDEAIDAAMAKEAGNGDQ